MSSAKRRTCYSIEQKNAILRRLESGLTASNVAKEFNISHSTVSTIKKNKHQIEALVKANILKKKRLRTSNHKEVECALLKYLKTNRDEGGAPLTGVMLQEKANTIAEEFNIKDFHCTSGWISRFKIRNNLIKNKKSKGTTASTNQNCNNINAPTPTDEKCSVSDYFGMLPVLDPVLDSTELNSSQIKSLKSPDPDPDDSHMSNNSPNTTGSAESLAEDCKRNFEISLPEIVYNKRPHFDEEHTEDYDRLNVEGNRTASVAEPDIWDAVGRFVAANGREWAQKNVKLAHQFKSAIYKLLADFEEKAVETEDSEKMGHQENFTR